MGVYTTDYAEIEKAKDLVVVAEPIKFVDDVEITYEILRSALEEEIGKYGVPVKFKMGTINYGRFSGSDEALFIVNPEKYDNYYKIVIMLKRQGRVQSVELYSCGKSTQMNAEAIAENVRIFDGTGVSGTAIGLLRGGSHGVGFAIGSAAAGITKAGIKSIGKGINALVRDPKALEEEKGWYDIVFTAIYTLFS